LLAIKVPLLLAEWCPVNAPDLRNHFANQPLTLHAIELAAALNEMISPIGWHHGGIND